MDSGDRGPRPLPGVKDLFFRNLLLLGFNVQKEQEASKISFTPTMFDRANATGMEIVLHFLLDRIDPDSKAFERIWPIMERTQGRDFRRVSFQILSQYEKDGLLPPGSVRQSHLQSCMGQRFYSFIYRVSALALKKVLLRDFGMDFFMHPVVEPLGELNEDLFHSRMNALRLMIRREAQEFTDECARQLKVQSRWFVAAHKLTGLHRRYVDERVDLQARRRIFDEAMRNAETKLEDDMSTMHGNGSGNVQNGEGGHMVGKKVLDGQKDLAKETWENLSRYMQDREEIHEIVEAIVSKKEESFVLDGEKLREQFGLPDDLFRQHARARSASETRTMMAGTRTTDFFGESEAGDGAQDLEGFEEDSTMHFGRGSGKAALDVPALLERYSLCSTELMQTMQKCVFGTTKEEDGRLGAEEHRPSGVRVLDPVMIDGVEQQAKKHESYVISLRKFEELLEKSVEDVQKSLDVLRVPSSSSSSSSSSSVVDVRTKGERSSGTIDSRMEKTPQSPEFDPDEEVKEEGKGGMVAFSHVEGEQPPLRRVPKHELVPPTPAVRLRSRPISRFPLERDPPNRQPLSSSPLLTDDGSEEGSDGKHRRVQFVGDAIGESASPLSVYRAIYGDRTTSIRDLQMEIAEQARRAIDQMQELSRVRKSSQSGSTLGQKEEEHVEDDSEKRRAGRHRDAGVALKARGDHAESRKDIEEEVEEVDFIHRVSSPDPDGSGVVDDEDLPPRIRSIRAQEQMEKMREMQDRFDSLTQELVVGSPLVPLERESTRIERTQTPPREVKRKGGVHSLADGVVEDMIRGTTPQQQMRLMWNPKMMDEQWAFDHRPRLAHTPMRK